MESLSDQLSPVFAAHDDPARSAAYRDRAERARHLLAHGYTVTDLNELARSFPAGPEWLDPKRIDYGNPLAMWQAEVARLDRQAQEAALDLRSIATRPRAGPVESLVIALAEFPRGCSSNLPTLAVSG